MKISAPSFPAKELAIKRTAALALALAAFVCLSSPVAFATADTTSSQSSVSSRNESDPDANVSEVIVSSNPQETLGTVGFSEANTKRIAVGKSTYLYLTVKDMGRNIYTTFDTSDKTIATVKRVDDRAVKVVGVKSGTVTITATVESSKGTKISTYELEIVEGDSLVSDDNAATVVSGNDNNSDNIGIITDYNEDDLDLYSSTDDPMLTAYAKQRRTGNATSLLLGLIGWVLIILSAVYIFSVVIRSRTPKLNVSPGARKRYSAGGSGSPRSGSRLLPNKYYRNLKKY